MVNLVKTWLRLAPNDQFWSFCRFFYFFPKMRLRLTQNGQFHLIHNFSPSFATKASHFWRNLKNFHSWGGVNGKFFEIFKFFELFHTKVAQNDTQCPTWPKKWLRLAPNGQIWSFWIFFYLFVQNEAQIDSEWPISPNSQLSHLLPPKCLISGEILKIFVPGGSTLANFGDFQIFQIISHQSGSK